MSTTNEQLLRKIRHGEAVLRARAAETAAREAELDDLKQSLAKLENTRSGIRAAIEDALSGDDPADQETAVAPADLMELAVEGNNDPFEGSGNSNLSAEEALALALAHMRDGMGPKALVKLIIRTAVATSGVDAEGVIKAALEAGHCRDLTEKEVVMAALQAARNTSASVSEIIRPAVGVCIQLGAEVPVVMREVFAACTPRLDPSMIRTSLLGVLGAAKGMGMSYQEVKDVMRTFSREVKFGAGAADEPEQRVRFSTPLETQFPHTSQPEQPEGSPSNTACPSYEDIANPPVVRSPRDSPLEHTNDGAPGTSSQGEASTMRPPPLHNTSSESSRIVVVQGCAGKRRAVDDDEEDYYDDGQPRPSKKVKMGFEGGQDGCQ